MQNANKERLISALLALQVSIRDGMIYCNPYTHPVEDMGRVEYVQQISLHLSTVLSFTSIVRSIDQIIPCTVEEYVAFVDGVVSVMQKISRMEGSFSLTFPESLPALAWIRRSIAYLDNPEMGDEDG